MPREDQKIKQNMFEDEIDREMAERALRRQMRRKKRKEQERKQRLFMIGFLGGVTLVLAMVALLLIKTAVEHRKVNPADVVVPEYVEVLYLTPNEFSRPEIPLEEVDNIVVHYVGNPCSTALENRNYFESLKDQTGTNATSVSSHFVIGLEGEVVQCIPLSEVSYASNHRNKDTISIECCHPDTTGRFYKSTYQTLVNLCAYLCHELKLEAEDVIRHYDVTGKICPKYYVENEEEWTSFIEDVDAALKILKK